MANSNLDKDDALKSLKSKTSLVSELEGIIKGLERKLAERVKEMGEQIYEMKVVIRNQKQEEKENI